MNILIFGGVGFIGSNLVVESIKRGHSVVVMDNLWRQGVSDNLKYLQETYKDKFKFVWGDIRNPEDIENNEVGKVDAVISMAANPGAITSVLQPVYDFRSNAMGTFNVCEFARKRGLKMLYASTTKTMSDIFNTFPMVETDKRMEPTIGEYPDVTKVGLDFENGKAVAVNDKFPIDGFGKWGHSPYGISKLTGELYVQEFHVTFKVPVVIFRMSCIYGIFQKGGLEQGWISWFLKQLLKDNGKITIFGNGKQVRDVLDGRDVARAYLDALENIDKVDGMVYTIGGGMKYNFSLLEAIDLLEKMTGKKANLSFAKKRPADGDWYVSSLLKIKKDLGWEPKISPEQTIRDMIEEMK